MVDVTGIEPATPCLQSKQKFNLSRCFGCAYQFQALLRLLQSCSKSTEATHCFEGSPSSDSLRIHCVPQAHFPGLIPPRKPDSFRLAGNNPLGRLGDTDMRMEVAQISPRLGESPSLRELAGSFAVLFAS